MMDITLEEFAKNWEKYSVIIKGQTVKLKDRYMICWDIHNGGVLLDEGGEQGGSISLFKVENGNLVSINPTNTSESRIIGKLIDIGMKKEKILSGDMDIQKRLKEANSIFEEARIAYQKKLKSIQESCKHWRTVKNTTNANPLFTDTWEDCVICGKMINFKSANSPE